jgi:putative resolvase
MRIQDAATQLNVSTQSIRRYVNEGRLECNLTPSGQRVFSQEQVDDFKIKEGLMVARTLQTRTVYYVRSSDGDKQRIESQIVSLTRSCGDPLKIFKDNGSGLNENRKGLASLIKSATNKEFDLLVITQKDRLTRFGYSYLETLFNQNNVQVKVLFEDDKTDLTNELMKDFMSLLASFSGKFYRLRGREQQKQLLQNAENKLNP